MCDNPECAGHGKTTEELEESAMETILKYGHQIIGVIGAAPGDTISYSLGRTVRHLPEFVITGPLNYKVAGYMINEAARMMDEDGTPVENGYVFEPDTLIEGFPVRVVAVDPDEYEINWTRYLLGDDDIALLQLVWPDTEGNWPDSPEYDQRFTQPIRPLQGSTT